MSRKRKVSPFTKGSHRGWGWSTPAWLIEQRASSSKQKKRK